MADRQGAAEQQATVLFRHKVDGREFRTTGTTIPSTSFLDAHEDYERVSEQPKQAAPARKRAAKAPKEG